MGYLTALDSTNPKFTGQSRDAETTLDWFEVRHMSGAQGRFQSVDPGNAGADPTDPQTWNAYAYVGNNPLSYTDPSGMFLCATCVGAASGGPPGALIGALIDAGAALAGLFGLGGSGHTPALADFSFPNQVPLDTLSDDSLSLSFADQESSPSVWNQVQAWWNLRFFGAPTKKPPTAIPCVNGFQEPTIAQSGSVLAAAQHHLHTDYMEIGQCTGLVCTSIRESLNPGFQKNGPVSNVVKNIGLKSISAGSARSGDVIVFGTSHMGINAPEAPNGRTVISAQGGPGRENNPGVVFGKPGWFPGAPSFYRVLAACRQ